ncbi:MAG: citrate synthase [Gemmataceae bacterium]|jgi:citrate synthase|nr:citrate synthase [Gemmataceae bacterium]
MSQTEIPAGLADVPVTKTAISDIDGKNATLFYRGIPVQVLARESSFEETSWLLLKGDLPTQRELANFHFDLRSRRKVHYRLLEALKNFPESGHPMDALQASVAALGLFYPSRNVSDAAANWEASLRIIASMPTLVAAFARLRSGEMPIEPHPDLDHAANFYYMLFGKEPSASVRKVIDACLILHAEHHMNASTFTARVAGSSLANPYQVIAAAVGSLSGPLHGGANEEVLEQLKEIGSPDRVQAWLEQKRASNPSFKVMGLGHRVYKVKDPRATVLQDLAERVFAESTRPILYDVAVELEKACLPIYGPKGVFPNVDFYSGVVYSALKIPTDLFTPIFAIARVSGWLAHWFEQLQNNRIYRPDAPYIGKQNVTYTPLEKRP